MDQRIIGIGCFGKPDTFSRVLAKIMANCLLVKEYDDRLIQELSIELLPISGRKNSGLAVQGNITGIKGFFLAVEKQRLKLFVVTRKGDRQKKRYTFSLVQLNYN